jgi:hypothetical protein
VLGKSRGEVNGVQKFFVAFLFRTERKLRAGELVAFAATGFVLPVEMNTASDCDLLLLRGLLCSLLGHFGLGDFLHSFLSGFLCSFLHGHIAS